MTGEDINPCEVDVFPAEKVKLDSDMRGHCFAQRWIAAVMGMWFGVTVYILNTNMSVAIVCMVKAPNPYLKMNMSSVQLPDQHNRTMNENELNYTVNKTATHMLENESLISTNDSRYLHSSNKDLTRLANVEYRKHEQLPLITNGIKSTCETLDSDHKIDATAEFTWDKTTQAMVLSGFFYGYMVTPLLGGWLSRKFGGKIIISFCMIIATVTTLLIPTLARAHVYALVAARVLIGISGGLALPGWFSLTGVWALPNERSRFVGMAWLGQMLGTIVGYTSSGFLCAYGFDNGWGSIFYIHGLFVAVFVVCWLVLVYNSPESHPRISTAEKRLLEKYHQSNALVKQTTDNIPWRGMFTYIPLYAMIFAHVCNNWTLYLILTCLPMYLKEVLKFNIKSNGVFSSLPFITAIAGIVVASVLADFFITRKRMTVTSIRKLFQITGFLGVAAFIVIPGFLECDKRDIVIVCICFCTFFENFEAAGFPCNAVDMSPKYSALIFGISNTVASVPGIIAPTVVASLTKHQTSDEWRVILLISAIVSICGAVTYGLFSSSELAPWSGENQVTEIEVEAENPLQDEHKGEHNKENTAILDYSLR